MLQIPTLKTVHVDTDNHANNYKYNK